MPAVTIIALPCLISGGAEPGELSFEINLQRGEKHTGSALVQCFWRPCRLPLRGARLSRTLGLIAARLIGRRGDIALISAPDGFISCVEAASIRSWPSSTDDEGSSGQDGRPRPGTSGRALPRLAANG